MRADAKTIQQGLELMGGYAAGDFPGATRAVLIRFWRGF